MVFTVVVNEVDIPEALVMGCCKMAGSATLAVDGTAPESAITSAASFASPVYVFSDVIVDMLVVTVEEK